MKNKYKLPKDVYQSVLWIVRGQVRRENEYKKSQSDILESSGANYESIVDKKDPSKEKERVYLPHGNGNSQSSTEVKALALQALEDKPETLKMKAVQQALNECCDDIDNLGLKSKLQIAIIKNINNRNDFPYRKLYIPGISEKDFYFHKAYFIYLVAKKINFI